MLTMIINIKMVPVTPRLPFLKRMGNIGTNPRFTIKNRTVVPLGSTVLFLFPLIYFQSFSISSTLNFISSAIRLISIPFCSISRAKRFLSSSCPFSIPSLLANSNIPDIVGYGLNVSI